MRFTAPVRCRGAAARAPSAIVAPTAAPARCSALLLPAPCAHSSSSLGLRLLCPSLALPFVPSLIKTDSTHDLTAARRDSFTFTGRL